MRKLSNTGMAATLVGVIAVAGVSGYSIADPGHGSGYGYGQGMGPGGMGYGGRMMGPGMMGPGGYGGHMMGPGGMGYGGHMMGPYGGGMGYGMMGPGMGYGGPGLMGPGGRGFAALDLKVEDVKTWFTRRLAIRGNKRLKLGKVIKKDDNTILAEVVTLEGSLVERYAVDRRTGFMRSVE